MHKLLPALASALLLAVAVPVVSQETEGWLENGYYDGAFNDGIFENDWYYDAYGADLGSDWTGDSAWYTDNEFYSGLYDDAITDNDWFYDSYDDPGDAGIFDV